MKLTKRRRFIFNIFSAFDYHTASPRPIAGFYALAHKYYDDIIAASRRGGSLIMRFSSRATRLLLAISISRHTADYASLTYLFPLIFH